MTNFDKYDIERIADEFVDECIGEEIIKQIIRPVKGDVERPLNKDLSIKLMEQPDLPFKWAENGELTITFGEDGDVVIDPNAPSEVDLENRITEVLPLPSFSIDCGGVKSRQIESKAFYVVCILNKFRGGDVTDKIKYILEDYNFKTMNNSEGDMVFKPFLEELMLENNKILDLIVAACYLKLTASEVKKDLVLRQMLIKEDASALEALEKRISNDSTIKGLNATIARSDIKKWQRQQAIDLRVEEIQKILAQQSERLMLIYNVMKQTTDKVPIMTKLAINAKAKEKISNLQDEGKIIDAYEANLLLSKIKRRAMKEHLRQLKASQLIRVSKNDFDGLIPKM